MHDIENGILGGKNIHFCRNVNELFLDADLPLNSLPWSQTSTIFGWMGGIMFCMMAAGMYFFHNAMFLSLFISIALYHFAFCKYLRYKLTKLSELVSRQDSARPSDLKIQLVDWIRFHISSKKSVFAPKVVSCRING